MHFGRLPQHQLDAIDFALPPDPEGTVRLLDGMVKQEQPVQIFVGCPVWGNKDFVGTLYPAKTKAKDYLLEYGKQFNTIELNSTHYNVPSPELISRWAKTVPSGFRFCPKFPQRVSHRTAIDEPLPLTDRFLEAAYGLGDRLGTSFLQLPPWFGPEGGGIDRLYRFLQSLPIDFRVAVELRHEGWFQNNAINQELFAMLETVGSAAVITDTAGRRDVLHMQLTTNQVFVRFTGNNLHPTDMPRIQQWSDRLLHWVSKGIRTIYFLLHQPDEVHCAPIATELIKQLNQHSAIDLQPPKRYEPAQKQLF